MQKTTTFVSAGIDISSQKLDIYLRENERSGISQTFSNDEKGIKKMISFLGQHAFVKQKIVIESTGRYHLLLSIMLAESGLQVSVINPLKLKKYQTASIRKVKTDKADAKLLAEVAFLEKDLPVFKSSRKEIVLRQKISLMKSLEKITQRFEASASNYCKSVQNLGEEISVAENDLLKSIKEIKKKKSLLEKEIIKLVKTDKKSEKKVEILTSIPGVSEFLAAIISHFYFHEIGDNPKSWVAYVGMEVSVRESGNWKGKGRISKRGNKYVRKRLFGGAWGAVMNNECFKKYYYYLKEAGRSHIEALNIIARKLIRISFALLKNNKTFDSKYCFSY